MLNIAAKKGSAKMRFVLGNLFTFSLYSHALNNHFLTCVRYFLYIRGIGYDENQIIDKYMYEHDTNMNEKLYCLASSYTQAPSQHNQKNQIVVIKGTVS